MGHPSSRDVNPSRTDAGSAEDIDADVRRRYVASRAGIPAGAAVTVLHIGAESTAVATGKGKEAEALYVFKMGSRKTPAEYFSHDPITPGELENAIMAVEDELARARKLAAAGSKLLTTDATVREIALAAGLPDQPELNLNREAVEQTFGRLCAITLGLPRSREDIPADNAFAATVLILRELMHHLNFESITVKN
jgi:exopolyphosphatase/pppGpp-phosphohydrolase